MHERFSIGKVLGTSVRVWVRNAVPFLLLSALLYSPLIIWGVLSVRGAVTIESLDDVMPFTDASGPIILLSNVVVAAPLTYGAVMELGGRRASIGACVVTGLVRGVPAIVVGLLTVLLIGVGVIALLVGSIVIACVLFVAVPASVIERQGVVGALRRSRTLTKGHRLEILGLMAIWFAVQFEADRIVKRVIPEVRRDNVDDVLGAIQTWVYLDIARIVVIGSVGAVLSAVAYFYLREEKEGTSAEELAKVFE